MTAAMSMALQTAPLGLSRDKTLPCPRMRGRCRATQGGMIFLFASNEQK